MKKLSFVCSFLFILFLLIGCTTEDTGTTAATSATSTASTTSTTSTTSSSTTASTISSPSNLQYSEGVVEWDAVTNAFGYQIQIDSEVIDVTGTTYTFDSEDYGRFVVSVRTVYGINSDIVSEYSNPLTVTIYKELPVPSNVVQTGSLVTWSVVEDSTGYVVKYDGSEHFTNLTQFDINVVSPTNVQVMAVGSTENYIEDSVYSDPILFSIEVDSPTNVHYENGVLYWDAVSLASGYYLTINDGTPITVTGIQYDLDYAYVGSVTVSVIAYSDTTGYLYSETQDVSITCPALNLETPSNIDITDDVLSFSTVDYADGYDIYVSGVYYTSIEDNTYTIPSSISNIADSYIQVQAVSDIHNDSILSRLLYINTNVITTVEELQTMSQYGNYILGNDLHMTSEWTPLPFSGILDGNGYEIDGLLISLATNNIGLFSTLDSAVIENLSVSGTIMVSSNIVSTNIGGLAGIVIDSTITNCNVSIDITATSNNGVGTLGGVFGRIESVDASLVTYVGTINATNFATGGFAGRANNSEHSSTIHQSKVDGGITTIGGEQAYTGGFIGLLANNAMVITESVASVDVVGPVYVGGFIGYLGSGNIANSYTLGTVTGTTNNLVHLGGFVGRVEGYNVTLVNCLSMMTITSGTITEFVYVGGFSGSTPGGAFGNIYQDCYYDNTLTALEPSGNDGVTNGLSSLPTVDLIAISTLDEGIWNVTGSLPILGWETD